MKLIEIIKLSDQLFADFGNRKKPGRISALYIVPEQKAYAVPLNIEHKDFILKLISKSPETNEFLQQACRVIPIDFDAELTYQGVGLKIASVRIGISGFEEHYGVRHDQKDLLSAKFFANKILKRSNQGNIIIYLEQKYVCSK